jgi:hypothetical protein
MPIMIALTTKVDWPPADFTPPDALVLRVRVPRGPTILESTALPLGIGGRYQAIVTIAEPGEYVMEAAVVEDGTPTDTFLASVTTLNVLPPAESTPAAEGPAGEGAGAAGGPNPFLIVGLLLMGALVVGFLLAGRRSPRGI